MEAALAEISQRQIATQETSASVSRPAEGTRLVGLDVARIFATLSVLWFHSIESDAVRTSGVLGRFSVSFYTMAAMVFLVDSVRRQSRGFGDYAADRVRRLYLPFIGWSVVTYLVVSIVKSMGGRDEVPALSWNMLVDGGTLHLWYIPFLLIASLMVFPVARWMLKCTGRQWFVAGLCVCIAAGLDFGAFDWVPKVDLPVVGRLMELSELRWSAIYWGIAVAIVWMNGLGTSRWRFAVAGVGMVGLAATLIWQWEFQIVAQLKVYGGLGLLLAALAPWRGQVVTALAPFGRLSGGVYYAHMAAIYVVRGILDGVVPMGGTALRDILVFVGAVLLSVMVVRALAMNAGFQWLACAKWKTKRLTPKPVRDEGYPAMGRGGILSRAMFRSLGKSFFGF